MSLPIVLIVAPITGENFSGLTYSVPSTVKGLHEIGVDVCLLTTSNEKPYAKEENFPVYYFKDEHGRKRNIEDLPYPFNKPDIIVFQSTYIPYHYKLAKEAIANGIPYVIAPRGGMTLRAQKSKWLKKKIGNLLFFNKFVQGASKIHCLTVKEADDVKKWNDNIFIIPNGIDLQLKEKLFTNKNLNTLKFTFIGRLDINHKGLDLLINGCSLIKQQLNNHKVVIDIYGPSVNDSKRRLNEMIKNLGLEEIITICNPVKEKEKKEILEKTDVFIHTSRFEGHPMSVLEALSYGIPCLLTPGTNVSSIVQKVGAGWEAPETSEGIANTIKKVLDDKEKLIGMGEKGWELIDGNYKWEKISLSLIEEFKDVITTKKGITD